MADYDNINAAPNFHLQVMGQRGHRKVDSLFVNSDEENYRVIECISAGTITVEQLNGLGDSPSTWDLLPGQRIYGLFSELTWTSGVFIAYIA